MNFYKRYMGDYGRDTAHLSLAEHGAYTLLLDHYYSTEQALPADSASLFRICRAFDKLEQRAVQSVADKFFPVGDDGLRHNERADRQMPDDLRAIKTARENGKKGGRPPKGTQLDTREQPSGNPAGFDSDNQTGTNSEPRAKTHQTPDTREEQKQKSLVQRAARSAARFPEFWAAYPVKKGRAEALAKWTARGLDAIADRIIADVQARKAHDRQWLDGYAPHGSTYVNGRGWEDEIETGRKPDRPGDGDGSSGVFGVAL